MIFIVDGDMKLYFQKLRCTVDTECMSVGEFKQSMTSWCVEDVVNRERCISPSQGV